MVHYLRWWCLLKRRSSSKKLAGVSLCLEHGSCYEMYKKTGVIIPRWGIITPVDCAAWHLRDTSVDKQRDVER